MFVKPFSQYICVENFEFIEARFDYDSNNQINHLVSAYEFTVICPGSFEETYRFSSGPALYMRKGRDFYLEPYGVAYNRGRVFRILNDWWLRISKDKVLFTGIKNIGAQMPANSQLDPVSFKKNRFLQYFCMLQVREFFRPISEPPIQPSSFQMAVKRGLKRFLKIHSMIGNREEESPQSRVFSKYSERLH
jgi:hypothetical protein